MGFAGCIAAFGGAIEHDIHHDRYGGRQSEGGAACVGISFEVVAIEVDRVGSNRDRRACVGRSGWPCHHARIRYASFRVSAAGPAFRSAQGGWVDPVSGRRSQGPLPAASTFSIGSTQQSRRQSERKKSQWLPSTRRRKGGARVAAIWFQDDRSSVGTTPRGGYFTFRCRS